MRSSERGQGLVIAALLVAALVGLASLVIDVGIAYVDRRQAQSAADAAALAGARELPSSATAAIASAQEWAAKNGYTDGVGAATVDVVTPYNGDPGKIEVTITSEQPSLFGRVLGLESITVQARAVAGRESSGSYAIYGANQDCNTRAVEFSSGSFAVYGNVHANAKLKMTGGSFAVYGLTTYRCSAQTSGGSFYFEAGPTEVGDPVDWPIYYDYTDFQPCTFYSSGDLDINPNTEEYFLEPGGPTLKPGLYCAEGDIHLSGSTIDGQVTFAAHGQIHFSGASFNFTPFTNNVVAFSDHAGNNAVQVSGSTFAWEGILMATQGEVSASGSSMSSPSGSILGDTVDLSGGSYSITADDQVTSMGPVRLLE